MRAACCMALILAAVLPASAQAGADSLFALTTDNQLRFFDGATPGNLSPPVTITGVPLPYRVMSIDERPANGELYGVALSGPDVQPITINQPTGAATALGNGFGLGAVPDGLSIDFDPADDVLRLVAQTPDPGCLPGGEDEYYVIDPTTGVAVAQSAVGYVGPDPVTDCPRVSGIAHSNSFAGATTSSLFDIDMNDNVLATQVGEGSAMTLVGRLGVTDGTDTNDRVGFDIAPDGTAYLSWVDRFGVNALGTVNLETGATTPIGPLGDSAPVIRDVAVLESAADPVPNVAPVVSRARMKRRRFAVGARSGFLFRLSEAAEVGIVIRRARRGRRWRRVGVLTRDGAQGANAIAFRGRLGRRRLRRGRYRALIRATDAQGARSKTAKLRFRIKKKRRRR